MPPKLPRGRYVPGDTIVIAVAPVGGGLVFKQRSGGAGEPHSRVEA